MFGNSCVVTVEGGVQAVHTEQKAPGFLKDLRARPQPAPRKCFTPYGANSGRPVWLASTDARSDEIVLQPA